MLKDNEQRFKDALRADLGRPDVETELYVTNLSSLPPTRGETRVEALVNVLQYRLPRDADRRQDCVRQHRAVDLNAESCV